MNCLDCDPIPRDAIAVCTMCGAAVCREHLVESTRHLTKPAPLMREIPVEPAIRVVRCVTCAAAARAADHELIRPRYN